MTGAARGTPHHDDVSADREQDGYGVNCDKAPATGLQMDASDMVAGVAQLVDEESKGLTDQGDVDREEEPDKDTNWTLENEHDNRWKIEANGNGSRDSDNLSVGKVTALIS